jgi:hypothetical protein
MNANTNNINALPLAIGTAVQFKGHAPTTGEIVGYGTAPNMFLRQLPAYRVKWNDGKFSIVGGTQMQCPRSIVAI